MTHIFLRLSLLLLLYIGILARVPAQTLKIMPLGNSITQGNTTYPSYRYELWKKLVDAGIDVEFVGSHDVNNGGSPSVKGTSYNGKTYTNRNEGHWGWRADQILEGYNNDNGPDKLSDWLEGYTPDIALIHLGTNDIMQKPDTEPSETTIQETLEEVRLVIETIKSKNPNVKILLAQLIPVRTNTVGQTTADNIQLFNEKIPDLAASLNRDVPEYVYVVDQNTGFNPDYKTESGDTYDGIHPDTSGELKMADNWFTGIQSAMSTLPVTLSGFRAEVTAAGKVQLHWSTAMEKDNHFFSVERSADGTTYEVVGRVAGKGNSTTSISYSFLDSTTPAGEVYYRLRQVDFDGTETVSAVIVARARAGNRSGMSIYPTKSKGSPVMLQLWSLRPGEQVKIAVYSANGRLVKQYSFVADASGNMSLPLDFTFQQAQGLYFIKVRSQDKMLSGKVMIEK